jgi:hypothetical protein
MVMMNRAAAVEILADAGKPLAFAESATRNLAEHGIIRRAPASRPKKDTKAFAYDYDELVAIISTLAAPAAANAGRRRNNCAVERCDRHHRLRSHYNARCSPSWRRVRAR